MKSKRIAKAKQIFDDYGGIVKSAILREEKFCSKDITELVSDGYLSKVKTGYYIWIRDADLSDLSLAASVIKSGVICLLSAAQYHDLTTVNPEAIDIAVPAGGKSPVLPCYPPIHLHRFKKTHFYLGITEVTPDRSPVQIYNAERTICDLFRMRNRYGMDIALEALKAYMRRKDLNLQKLFDIAAKMRLKTIIKPYVEALL